MTNIEVRVLRSLDVHGYERLRRMRLIESPLAFSDRVDDEWLAGLGVGRLLMSAPIDVARDAEGVSLVQLGVRSESTAARTLYASFGFETGARRNTQSYWKVVPSTNT